MAIARPTTFIARESHRGKGRRLRLIFGDAVLDMIVFL
jgi:hypothetical protein